MNEIREHVVDPPSPLPVRLPRSADLVIIGGGIAGVADAFFASRAGLQTVIIDKQSQLGAYTTSQAMGMIRCQWDVPEIVSLTMASAEFYRRFGTETGLSGWNLGIGEQGWMRVTTRKTALPFFKKWAAANRRLGVDGVEYLEGGEAISRFPWLSRSVRAATYRARDFWLSPYEATQGFARASGAVVLLRTTVRALRFSKGRVTGVVTERGSISAPIVVLAAGAFSHQFATSLGVSLPVTMVRHHRAFISPQPEIPASAPMTADYDRRVVWRPDGVGAAIGMQSGEAPSQPADSVPIDWTFPAFAMQAAGRATPFWRTVASRIASSQISLGAGLYTCTADSLPVIGSVSSHPGLFVHTGDNGMGVAIAPEASRRLIELVTAGRHHRRVNPFAVDRDMRRRPPLVY